MEQQPKIDVKKIEAFLLANPQIVVMGMLVGILALVRPTPRPAWVKDLPPIGGRTNGSWRGKGSFGKGFGPNRVRHR